MAQTVETGCWLGRHFIAGQWREADGERFENTNPALIRRFWAATLAGEKPTWTRRWRRRERRSLRGGA